MAMQHLVISESPAARAPHMAGDDCDAIRAQAAVIAGVGGFRCDLSTDRLSWTPETFALFGFMGGPAPDRREVLPLYSDASRDMLHRLRGHAIATGTGFAMDADIVRPDGVRRTVRITAQTVLEGGRARYLHGAKLDVTAERQAVAEWRQQAEHDALTGIGNRSAYDRTFLNHRGPLRPGALLLLDCDRFKSINDRWGHAAGDAILCELAARLTVTFPGAQLVARIGGDEFAVLLPSEIADGSLRRLQAAMAQLAGPVALPMGIATIALSAGLARYANGDARTPEAIHADADAALYRAKRAGRGRLAIVPDHGMIPAPILIA